MKRLFTGMISANEMEWGLYDRWLYRLVHFLNDHMEARHARQWEKEGRIPEREQ